MSVIDSKLKKLLKEYNLSLQLLPLEGKGFIMSSPTDDPDVIVVNSNLSDDEMEDDCSCHDYKYSYITRLISEIGVNDFLIQQKIKQFVALNNEPLDANYINVTNSIGIADYYESKRKVGEIHY